MAVELPNSGNTTLSLPPNTANDLAAMRNYLKRLVGELEKAIGKQFDNTSSVAAEVGGDVDLTTGVVGILPTANGGTGSEEAANAASGVCILDAGGKVATTNLPVGTGANNIVQLNGSSQLPAVSGALLTNLPNNSLSNVIYAWHGQEYGTTNSRHLHMNATGAADTTIWYVFYTHANGSYDTYSTIDDNVFAFTKIASINTLTLHARMKAGGTDNGVQPRLRLTLGGLSAVATCANSTSYNWASGTVDISSLTNGTTYYALVEFGCTTGDAAPFLVAYTVIAS